MQTRAIVGTGSPATDAEDIVWGAEQIGHVIGVDVRRAFYLLTRGLLPAKQVGRAWVASRSKLLAAVVG
jgi:hypothetical protein